MRRSNTAAMYCWWAALMRRRADQQGTLQVGLKLGGLVKTFNVVVGNRLLAIGN